jgi:hypothetical protein
MPLAWFNLKDVELSNIVSSPSVSPGLRCRYGLMTTYDLSRESTANFLTVEGTPALLRMALRIDIKASGFKKASERQVKQPI